MTTSSQVREFPIGPFRESAMRWLDAVGRGEGAGRGLDRVLEAHEPALAHAGGLDGGDGGGARCRGDRSGEREAACCSDGSTCSRA